MITNDFISSATLGQASDRRILRRTGSLGRRASEPAQAFADSTESASVRFEPKSMSNQMSVWNKVVELQEALLSHLPSRTSNPVERHSKCGFADKHSAHANQSTCQEGSQCVYQSACRSAPGQQRRGGVCICSQWRVEERGCRNPLLPCGRSC